MTCREARKEKPIAGGVLFFVTVFCRWSEIGWPSCFFYSFYYLTISRWLFPFSKFLLCLWRVATEAPPFWIGVESWGEKCVRGRFSFQFLTRRSISTRQKKQKKTRGCSSEESSPLPDEKKKEKAMVQLPPFSKAVSQQSNDLHPLPVFSVFTLHVCPLSPYKALCDEPV